MKALFSAFALLLAVNASAQTKAWLEGEHSAVKKPMAVAIQDTKEWNRVWRSHGAAGPAPAVDFAKQSVVAVFLGETETEGVKVTVVVQKDPLDSRRINVFYRATAVNKGFSAQVECQPFAIVKVPHAAVIDVEREPGAGVPERAVPPSVPKRDDRSFHALIDGLGNPPFDGGRP
ncbi:MAG: protease complex subunit PrcB family protein [Elusimicrobiota bacterium]